MRLRRYFPLLGAVAFIAVCVFLGRSEKLQSEAGRVGCGGTAGVAQDLSALGTADDNTRSNVAELAELPMAASEVQLADNADAIARLNDALTRDVIGTAPAVAERFQEDGCYKPGSARVADLIGHVATQPQISANQRQIFVNVLLNSATFAASQVPANFQTQQKREGESVFQLAPQIAANERLEPAFASIRAAISENNGQGIRDSVTEIAQAEAPKLNSEKLDHFNQQTCTIRAFEAVAAIVRHDVEAPEKTAYRIYDSLDALPAMDKGAYKLVEALAHVAPAIQPWDAHFLAIAMNKNFDDATRGLACKNAATRGNDLSAIRKIAADVKLPLQISDCLLAYQKEGGEEAIDQPGSLNLPTAPGIQLDRRIEVIRSTNVVPDQAGIVVKVQNLFEPSNMINFSNLGTLQGITANGMSLREKIARADLVAQEIAKLPVASHPNILDEIGRLEQLSPANSSFGHHLRGLIARRGPASINQEVTGIQQDENAGATDPNIVADPNSLSNKKPIDIEKAVQEIQQKSNPNGIGSMNADAPKEGVGAVSGEELQNGKPVKLPKLGQ